MAAEKKSFFTWLVYIAYVYFIAIGGAFLYANFVSSRSFSYLGFAIVLLFSIQAYYRNKLVNLITGIISLFLSIWFLLDIISSYDLMAKNTSLDIGGKVMVAFSFINIIMSGILMFSFMKLKSNEHS